MFGLIRESTCFKKLSLQEGYMMEGYRKLAEHHYQEVHALNERVRKAIFGLPQEYREGFCLSIGWLLEDLDSK